LSQRIIELLIGRLITDEEFRSTFLAEPQQLLSALCEAGVDLSRTEIAALVNTEHTIWERTADGIDPRLQRASLKNPAPRDPGNVPTRPRIRYRA
jgi:hypothetical protein